MTTAFLEDVANAPEPEVPPEDDWSTAVVTEPSPQRTRQRRSPRKPKIDPDTGEEITPAARIPRNSTLKEQLLEPYVSLASDLSAVAPTTAGVLIVRAEKTVDGIVDLASGHKRTMAALRKVAKGGKAIDLVETLLMLVIAAAVDFGRLPVESPLLDMIGHVEIVRDSAGKFAKDAQGKMIKEKTSLRDIRDKMIPEGQDEAPVGPPPMPRWSGPVEGDFATGTGPLRPPVPMNNVWVEPPR